MFDEADDNPALFCESEDGLRLALGPVPDTVPAIQWTTMTPSQEQALMQATASYLDEVHTILTSRLASC